MLCVYVCECTQIGVTICFHYMSIRPSSVSSVFADDGLIDVQWVTCNGLWFCTHFAVIATVYLKVESHFASHTLCTKMLLSNWRLKAIVPKVLYAAKWLGLLTFSCVIVKSWILSFYWWNLRTRISTYPSYLISHCICLNSKTPNAQKLDMQTLDHLLQYQNSLNSEAEHADFRLFASIPKPIKHKSYTCRLPIVCLNTKTH